MKRISVIGRSKILRVLLLSAAAVGVVLLAGALGRKSTSVQRVKTNEDRVRYVESLGWKVETAPAAEKEITLPEVFPDVLKNYNEIQKQQGFDLEKYSGKKIMMYTYDVLNYPEDENVQCSLYVYKNRIIGGDLHSTAFSGFMKPLTDRG
ncbi:MAG: DUF4830 domain-containing protein [Oscillospiraceae bacterium]|nr:DUF4830 domain-containing protein [Oscillospiraceae bacterium]